MASRFNEIPSSWWIKSGFAGLVGGIAMAIAWSIGSSLTGSGFWTPLNTIGTTVPVPAISTQFGFDTLGGALLHLMTASCWGVLLSAGLAFLAPSYTRTLGRTLVAGLLFGVVAFTLMGLILGPMLNPAIIRMSGFNYFIGHLVWGAVTAYMLHSMARRSGLRVTIAPAVGVAEAPYMTTRTRP